MKIDYSGMFSAGDRVAVALSGGEDSVALFNILCDAAPTLGVEVLAINVEHGIRGGSSVADSEFVRKLCEEKGKELLFYRVDVPTYACERKMGIEAAARELRYNCFFSAIENGLCDKIATAHHASDNTESILFNILRGSGVKGLVGIERIAYGGKIVRPLINTPKEQITAYIAQKQLKYVVDATNYDDSFSRNFLRNKIVPDIKGRFPDLDNSLYRLGEICREEDEFMDSLAESLVSGALGESKIKFSYAALPIFKRAVIMAMKRAGLEKDYEKTHVDAITSLLNGETGNSVHLPHGFKATRGYGEIVIYKDKPAVSFEYNFSVGVFDLDCGTLTIEKTEYPQGAKEQKTAFFAQEKQKGILYISQNTPLDGAVIRNRRVGDRFKKFGGGTKPLKEFLIDIKVLKRHRESLAVCAVGGDVLFVAGVEISSVAMAKDGEPVYKITYKRKEC